MIDLELLTPMEQAINTKTSVNTKDSPGEYENHIYWIMGDKIALVDIVQPRYKTRMRKLAEEYPEECKIEVESHGAMIVSVPVKWIKINPPRKLSDERRNALAERLRNVSTQGKINAKIE